MTQTQCVLQAKWTEFKSTMSKAAVPVSQIHDESSSSSVCSVDVGFVFSSATAKSIYITKMSLPRNCTHKPPGL